MKSHFSIKYTVKVVSISNLGQKVHFTIRHPEDAEMITGIAVTATKLRPSGRAVFQSDTTGHLSLASPDKGDVFYTESIKAEQFDFRDLTEKRIGLAYVPKQFGFSGKRLEYFNTAIDTSQALLEGYYEDGSSSGLVIIGGDAHRELYRVTLYLRYKMKSPK